MFEASRDDTGKVQSLQRLSDGSWIPLDPRNRDYQEFLEWNKKQDVPLDVTTKPPIVPIYKSTDELLIELSALKPEYYTKLVSLLIIEKLFAEPNWAIKNGVDITSVET